MLRSKNRISLGIVDFFLQILGDVPGNNAIYNTRSEAFPPVSHLVKKERLGTVVRHTVYFQLGWIASLENMQRTRVDKRIFWPQYFRKN